MALLGGANSVWGPILGVVPLVLIQDYLSIAWASHFSVLLGLVLLGVVFFIPNGLIGLLHSARTRAQGYSLADYLEAWAARLRGRPPSPQHTALNARAKQNGPATVPTQLGAAGSEEHKARR
jgi:hypothetical protein